jgi:hypothetical protein
MSDRITAALARLVRARANDVCEYCRLPQWSQEATFHVDHVQPTAAGGPSTAANLALACVTCSLRKGARTRSRDPKTGLAVKLFDPRRQSWPAHFRWSRTWRVVGRTPTGRATVTALGMNRIAVVRLRQIWAELGRFPPAASEPESP